MCCVHTCAQIFRPPRWPSWPLRTPPREFEEAFSGVQERILTSIELHRPSSTYLERLLIPTRSQHGVQVALLKPSRPHQDLQRTTLQALRRTHGCRKWLKLDLRRTHDGPKMAPRWPRIAPNVPKMDPRWPHEAPRHTIIKICVLVHKTWGVRSGPCFHR